MAKDKKPNPNFSTGRIISGEGVASFPHLKEPDTSKFGGNKYKLDVIFKDGQEKSLVEACNKHAMARFGKTDGIRMPFKVGAESANAKYEGYAEGIYVTAKSGQQPTVVDHNKKPIEGDTIYGGAIVRINVTTHTYEREEKVKVVENGVTREEKMVEQGVTLLLNAVQFVKDGNRFGGGPPADGGFGDEYVTETAEEDDGGF